MKYLLLSACAVTGLFARSPAIAARVEEQQHVELLRQQQMDAQVRSSEQSKIKRLEQKKQGAISYPMMEEMAENIRRNQPRISPDERGLWSLMHSGKTSALNSEIMRLRKLYPRWKPPALLLQASMAGKGDQTAVNDQSVTDDKMGMVDNSQNYDLALAQFNAGKHTAALSLLQNDNTPIARGLRGSILFEQGLAEYQSENFSSASRLWQEAIENGHDGRDVQLMQAWTDLRLGNSQAALQRFILLYQQPDNEVALGIYQAAHASGRQEQLQLWMNADPDDPLRRLARKQRSEFLAQQGWIWAARSSSMDTIPELEGIQGPSLDVAVAARRKSGGSGFSHLNIDMIPAIELQYGKGNDVFMFRLTHLSLNSGSLPAAAIFGSYSAGASYVAEPTTDASGWIPNVRWRHESDGNAYQVSLGTTQTGSPVGITPTVEVMTERISEQGSWRLSVYRNSVRDSILSAVGAVDPYSGQVWGRVLRNGVRADVFHMLGGPWSVNGNARAEFIEGRNVADNSRVAAALGLGYDLGVKNFAYFTVGPGIDFDQYRNNLSHFTWGHGGYFSPQSFTNVGMAVRFLTQEGGRSLLRGQVSVGWQHIAEDSAPCFPLASAVTSATCASYAASSKQGLGSSIEGSWSYAITPAWHVGSALIWRNSLDYSDASFLLKLRYNWSERRSVYRTDLPEGMLGELY
jgi:TolA-binding protein